jgi:membrane protein DedA with SNARE-associated domain
MIESIVTFLLDLPIWGVFLATFLIAYIENLFPPSPSDVLLVFIGTMVGIGVVDLTTTLIVATVGSTTGFATAYWIGRYYGRSLIERGWVPFISVDLIDRVERWFSKYHGLIIIANRFLAGTRAVISFAAGMTRLPFPRTLIYCLLSAAVWNTLMLWIGTQVGSRWREVDAFIAGYGWVVTGILAIAFGIWLWRIRKRRTEGSAAE